MSFSSYTIRWRAREKCNKGCFGFDQLYGIDWKEHYTRVPELFLYFLQWMLMQTYLMTIYFPALHKWNQFDHHHSTRVDNGFEHGVIYSKILVFKQVTCHSLLRGQSNLTNKYTLVRRTSRSRNYFATEVGAGVGGEGIHPINCPISFLNGTCARETNVTTYACWVFKHVLG